MAPPLRMDRPAGELPGGLHPRQEGDVKDRHLGTDLFGRAIQPQYAELRADVQPWWEEPSKVLRGDSVNEYP